MKSAKAPDTLGRGILGANERERARTSVTSAARAALLSAGFPTFLLRIRIARLVRSLMADTKPNRV